MDKYTVDLDSILDQLEENDDDSDRAHPPSLMMITNCNTLGFNASNNYPPIYSYREDRHSRRPQTTGDTSSSSQTNHYKKLFSTYIENSIEKLDTSEAEFGISIKPIETQNYSYKDSDKRIVENLNDAKDDKESNDELEKNKLISSLIEHSKWKTDTSLEITEYDIDSTSSEEEVSDEVLYISIDQNNVQNEGNESSIEGQIEIKLLPSNSGQVSKSEENVLSANNVTNGDLISDTNNESLIKSDSAVSDEPKETINLINIENEANYAQNSNNVNDIISEIFDEHIDENFVEPESDSNENSDELTKSNENHNLAKESIIENFDQSMDKCDETSLEKFDVLPELQSVKMCPISSEDKSKENFDNICEKESIESDINLNNNLNVIKFSDIEVNIDELTEEDIEKYLSDINDLDEVNELSDLNINLNDKIDDQLSQNIETNIQNGQLVDTNSISQSTSSISNEDNDEIQDISNYETCFQSNNNCVQTTDDNENYNDCNDNQNESLETHSNNNIPSKVMRPNTLPIVSNVNQLESDLSQESVANDLINNDNNVPNSDCNNINNSELINENLINGLSEDEQMLGKVKPFWIPDQETQMCMHCDIRFTVLKRRHHCRACGKVLCAQCCNSRAKLIYLDNKDARVCQICYATLKHIAEIQRNASESSQSSPSALSSDSLYPESTAGHSNNNIYSPDPNNPLEYCSTVSPLEQESNARNRAPLSIMVPIGVLKKADRPRGEPKQVVFSDGIRPGGDLTETSDHSHSQSFLRRSGRTQLKLKSPPVGSPTQPQSSFTSHKSKASRTVISDLNGTLPPIINYYDLTCNNPIKGKPTIITLIEILKNKDICPVTFALTKNLYIYAKIVLKDCCLSNECWTFSTKGFATIGQDELLVTLERLPDEDTFPRDIFRLFTFVYDNASKGTVFNDLSHVFFPDGLFGNKDNSGFLFIRPTLQCFSKLIMPSPPFLIGILIHKWEIPWAKVFPLRLVLRLGAEYKYYPCPIVSYRGRKPAYCEIGHTIMNVLADFRNFQYTLPIVPGLMIHLEEKKITVQLPRNRYEKISKVLTNSNEHVLAFGANFSMKADSHLVCMQNDDGQYQTQTINLEGATRKITGASFIVFSGALKSSTGLTAKMSIVEDGLLVQISPNSMIELRNSLKDMKNYDINCGKISEPQPDEVIRLLWGEEDTNFNLGVRSPIDGTNLEGIQSVRIYNGTDYTNDKFVIRWTEVFFLHMNESSRRADSLDPSRLAEMVSQAFCLVLTSHLDQLSENGFTKIGLRINLDTDKVGYETGSQGMPLPSNYTSELDGALIPVIMENISPLVEDLLVMELLFHLIVK